MTTEEKNFLAELTIFLRSQGASLECREEFDDDGERVRSRYVFAIAAGEDIDLQVATHETAQRPPRW